jgi:hypothetical protein
MGSDSTYSEVYSFFTNHLHKFVNGNCDGEKRGVGV